MHKLFGYNRNAFSPFMVIISPPPVVSQLAGKSPLLSSLKVSSKMRFPSGKKLLPVTMSWFVSLLEDFESFVFFSLSFFDFFSFFCFFFPVPKTLSMAWSVFLEDSFSTRLSTVLSAAFSAFSPSFLKNWACEDEMKNVQIISKTFVFICYILNL